LWWVFNFLNLDQCNRYLHQSFILNLLLLCGMVFFVYSERCEILGFMWINPCFFLSHVFQFLCQQVKIVISMDGVLVLINVVIANLIQLDLVLCVVLFCRLVQQLWLRLKMTCIVINIQQTCFINVLTWCEK